jgi:hypothetical protein
VTQKHVDPLDPDPEHWLQSFAFVQLPTGTVPSIRTGTGLLALGKFDKFYDCCSSDIVVSFIPTPQNGLDSLDKYAESVNTRVRLTLKIINHLRCQLEDMRKTRSHFLPPLHLLQF